MDVAERSRKVLPVCFREDKEARFRQEQKKP